MDRPLHPNLARIAAAYDEVVLDFQQGRIQAAEARRRILALVARDDNGIEWSLDPDSGRWRYRTKWNDFAHGEPPSYGVLTPTPHDLGSGTGKSPDERLTLHEVELSLLASPTALTGSTIVQHPKKGRSSRRMRISSRQLVGVLMIGVLLVGAWMVSGRL